MAEIAVVSGILRGAWDDDEERLVGHVDLLNKSKVMGLMEGLDEEDCGV